MSTEPTIRTGTMDDFSPVCRLLGELDDHHVEIRPDVFQSFDDPEKLRERVTGFVDPDDAEMFVAVIDDIVGLATVRIDDNPNAPMFRPGRRANMVDLVVDREFRGSGIAKLLLDRVVDWSRSRGLASLSTSVWNANQSALSFYTMSGFTNQCQRMDLRIDREQG